MLKTSMKGSILTIEIDTTDANFKLSKSGKTKVISTGGNVPVQGTEFKLGLNLMKSAK